MKPVVNLVRDFREIRSILHVVYISETGYKFQRFLGNILAFLNL